MLAVDQRPGLDYQAELLVLSREMCKRRLSVFIEEAWPIVEAGRRFVHGWHIDAIAEHLEAVISGQIRNLIINIPPRHMKSIETSVMFPAWGWIQKPSLRWLFGSYAESLSVRDSVKCRRIIQSDWYQQRFGSIYQLRGDQNEKKKYENDKTGHRIATSVHGTGTGEGGDILVIDDPHKVGEAESPTVREGVLEWWDQEMASRGNDPQKVAKIIVMQRLHERDLSGHLLERGGWDHLCLPAEYESSRKIITSIGWEDPRKDEGELLWPERFGRPEIDSLKRDLGSQGSAGQLQQRPSPAEGEIVKRAWWKFYREVPAEIDFIALSADLTFKDGEKNDFVAIGVWGKVGANKYLLDQFHARIGFNGQIQAFQNLCGKWTQASAKWVEEAANGAALIAILQSKIPGMIAVRPKGSKVARAEAVAPEIEAGNVFLPDPEIAPWVGDYIEEWAMFPNGAHDDQVDQTTQALLKFRELAVVDCLPISLTQRSKWNRF